MQKHMLECNYQFENLSKFDVYNMCVYRWKFDIIMCAYRWTCQLLIQNLVIFYLRCRHAYFSTDFTSGKKIITLNSCRQTFEPVRQLVKRRFSPICIQCGKKTQNFSKTKKSKIFGRLRDRLGDVRGSFSDRFGTIFKNSEIQNSIFLTGFRDYYYYYYDGRPSASRGPQGWSPGTFNIKNQSKIHQESIK